MNLQKTKKSLFFVTLIGLLFIFCTNSVVQVFAMQSAEKRIEVTEAQLILPDQGDEENISIGNDSEIFRLDIYLDGDGKSEIKQAEMDVIKEEYVAELEDSYKTISHFDGQYDAKEVLGLYNDLYRKDLSKYTEKNFKLDKILDIEVNQETLDKMSEDSSRYVKAYLDVGAGAKAEDPLPIILYKCTGEEEWQHFVFSHSEGETKNWCERDTDGRIIMYFYHFCPIMVYEASGVESSNNFWWILLIILFVLLLLFLLLLFIRRRKDDDEKAEEVAATTVVINNTVINNYGTAQNGETGTANDAMAMPLSGIGLGITGAGANVEENAEVSAEPNAEPSAKANVEAKLNVSAVGGAAVGGAMGLVAGGMVERTFYVLSFKAKLSDFGEKAKANYNKVKNCLMAYDTVVNQTTWTSDKFMFGKKTFATIKTKGKCVFLVINAKFVDLEKLKSVKAEDGKIKLRLTSVKNVKLAEKIIANVMAQKNLEKQIRKPKNYVMKKMRKTKLVKKGLAKVVTRKMPTYGFGKVGE